MAVWGGEDARRNRLCRRQGPNLSSQLTPVLVFGPLARTQVGRRQVGEAAATLE